MKILISLLLLISTYTYAAAPIIWENANFAKYLVNLGFHLNDGKAYFSLFVDPSAGAGVAAPVGSIGVRDNAGVGEIWAKYGVADTAWTNVLLGNTGWALLGNAGTNASTNFLGTTDGVDLVFRTNNTERFRLTAAGAYDTTFGTGILHSDASGILSSSPVDLASPDVSGILPLINGGTNNALTASAGSVVFSNSTQMAFTAPGSAGQFLTSNGTGAPSFQTLDIPKSNVVYVDKAGNDATCAPANQYLPCLTVAQALTLITAPSSGNRWQIKVGIGTFTEATLALPPWTWLVGSDGILQGGDSRISVTSGNVTLSAGWSAASIRGGFGNIYLTGSTGIIADFAGLGATGSHAIELNNVGLNGSITYNSNSGTLDFLDTYNIRVFGSINMHGGSFSLVESQVFSSIVVDDTTAQTFDGDIYDGYVAGNITAASVTNPVTLRIHDVIVDGSVTSSGALASVDSPLAYYKQAVPANWTTNPQAINTALDELAARTTSITGTAVSHSVYAGPVSGGPAAPSFRLLDPTDIPNLDASKITSGALSITVGGTGAQTASAAFQNLSPQTTKGDLIGYTTQPVRIPACPNGQYLRYDSAQPNGVICVVASSGGGSITPSVVTVSSDYVATSTDQYILADTTTGSVRVTIPAAATQGRWVFSVKKIDSTPNVVTVTASGSDTIDGDKDSTLSDPNVSSSYLSNGGSSYYVF